MKEQLASQFDFLDPMRRDYRGIEANSVDEIVRGDMEDINNSDVMLAYTPKPSVGTSMEIFYAHHVLGKTVYIICEDSRPSPWLVKFCTRMFKSVAEATEFLKQ